MPIRSPMRCSASNRVCSEAHSGRASFEGRDQTSSSMPSDKSNFASDTNPLPSRVHVDAVLRRLVDTRRGKAAVGHSDAHRWLFPGGDADQPMHPRALANRLKRIGVSVRDGRSTALIENASTLPAKVLSELLGLSVNAATRWNALAGVNNAEYAAAVARSRHASPPSHNRGASPTHSGTGVCPSTPTCPSRRSAT